MSAETVTFQNQDGIGLISLNRPEVHNVVNEAVMIELESILDRVETDPEIKGLILTGAGNQTFSAGGDFKYFATLPSRSDCLAMSKRMQAILNRFWRGQRVVIAAINGQALGGGCEILTACHFRLATPQAHFSFRQAANGVITGWGGGLRLFHLLGRSKALRLLLTAERIDATEALRIGLIDRLIPYENLITEAMALAKTIYNNSLDSITAFLELARCLIEEDLAYTTKRETEMFADCWVSKDFRKIMAKYTQLLDKAIQEPSED
ncbi:MAG: enoyl-CoA hydratase/isomerase family protein [Acidobacteriota bacterium]